MRATAIPSEAIHSRKIKFLSKLQLLDDISFKTFAKKVYLKNWSVCPPFMLLFIEKVIMDTGCYFYFFSS